jgi:hypothetical protein
MSKVLRRGPRRAPKAALFPKWRLVTGLLGLGLVGCDNGQREPGEPPLGQPQARNRACAAEISSVSAVIAGQREVEQSLARRTALGGLDQAARARHLGVARERELRRLRLFA